MHVFFGNRRELQTSPVTAGIREVDEIWIRSTDACSFGEVRRWISAPNTALFLFIAIAVQKPLSLGLTASV